MCWLLLVVFALSTVACGGSSGPSSLAPTSPTPVVPSYQGVWTGMWVRQQCSETGGAVGIGCNAFPLSGGLRLTLTQNAASVQGAIEVGMFQGSVSGPVSSTGALTLTGQGRQAGVTMNITSWTSSLSGNVMAGSFTFSAVPDNLSAGTVSVRANLQNVVKTS